MPSVTMTVNGKKADRRSREPHAAGAVPARASRSHRHACRLRHQPVRRLRRHVDGYLGQELHHARGAGRRRQRHDHRGPRRADGELHPMQEAFRENHGLQCGFCTPGMVMSAVDLVKRNKNPVRAGHPRLARGQYLPLHRLPQHREGDQGRRGGDGAGRKHDRPRSAPPFAAKEDQRFLTGKRQLHRRHQPPGTSSYAVFVRSPHAHAEIGTHRHRPRPRARRASSPIFTGDDIEKAGSAACPAAGCVKSKDGSPMAEPPHPVLAHGQSAPCRRPRRRRHRRQQGTSRQDAAELDRGRLRTAARRHRHRSRDEARRGRWSMTAVPNNVCYDWAHRRQGGGSTQSSPRRRMSPRSTSSTTASSPTRWSRARPFGEYDRGTGEHTL